MRNRGFDLMWWFIVGCCLLFAAKLYCKEWYATWNANTEPDLSGYNLYEYVEGGGRAEYRLIATIDTSFYAFEYDSTFLGFGYNPTPCLCVSAFDYSDNESAMSEVVCGEVSEQNGDVDDSGEVDSMDWSIIAEVMDSQRFLLEWQLKCDRNSDGVVDSLDVAIVKDQQGKIITQGAEQ